MIQETSKTAYIEIKPELGQRQEEVLNLIKDYTLKGKNLTNTEIGKILERPINAITPRTNELVKLGLVKESEKRRCNVTGRTAIAWSVIGNYQIILF